MSYREMMLQQGRYSDTLHTQEAESTMFIHILKSQSPMMLGWFAVMGLNLLFLLASFQ